MRRTLRAFLAVAGAGAGLAACSDQPTSAPVLPRTAGVNADVLTGCNFSTLRDAVRAYANISGNDSIFTYIRGMDTDAYNQGMNGLARLAQIRANGPKKTDATPAKGATAVGEFIKCMPTVGAVQTDFLANMALAMGQGGIFEVPKTTDNNPIYGLGEPAGTPFWTAKPSGANWNSLTGQRSVLFGYKLSPSDPLAGFDYNIIPMLAPGASFTSDLIVGLCRYGPDAVRLKHVTVVTVEILFDETIDCPNPNNSPPLAALSMWRGGFDLASVVRRGVSLFAPQPLHAAAAVFGGGVGGAVSELSPTFPLTVTPTLEYTSQPAPTPRIGEGLGVVIKVTSGGVPLNQADVTLKITGNSGLDALFQNENGEKCSYVTTQTNNLGVADFSSIPLIKPGGYTLTAFTSWDDLDGAAGVLSKPTNVKNDKKFKPPTATCPPLPQ